VTWPERGKRGRKTRRRRKRQAIGKTKAGGVDEGSIATYPPLTRKKREKTKKWNIGLGVIKKKNDGEQEFALVQPVSV